jgi:hypothetical protein
MLGDQICLHGKNALLRPLTNAFRTPRKALPGVGTTEVQRDVGLIVASPKLRITLAHRDWRVAAVARPLVTHIVPPDSMPVTATVALYRRQSVAINLIVHAHSKWCNDEAQRDAHSQARHALVRKV